jgi:hypothetical protein
MNSSADTLPSVEILLTEKEPPLPAMHTPSRADNLLGFKIIPQIEWPDIKVILSVCRAGGTALMRLFAEAGYATLYQPLKTTLRWGPTHDRVQLHLKNQNSLILKESIGPYFEEECNFDPVGHLQLMGIPPEKITVIFCLRDPKQVAYSWSKWFKDRPELPDAQPAGLLQSYRNLLSISENLKINGIVVEIESFDPGCNNKIEQLFDALSLSPSLNIADWNRPESPGFDAPNLMKIREPEKYRVPGILDDVKYGKAFGYIPKRVSLDAAWARTESLLEMLEINEKIIRAWSSGEP